MKIGGNKSFIQGALMLFFSIAILSISQGAGAAEFVVNSTDDIVDAAPGDGICETAPGNRICTLRGAVQEANARNTLYFGLSGSRALGKIGRHRTGFRRERI